MIKSLINKIKEQKNFQNFLQVQMDEIENKMSKIIIKFKKQIVNYGILKKKLFHISIIF